MATSDEEENIYTKPGAIRRSGNSSTAVGFFSRGVQPTEVQVEDDYSPPADPDPDPVVDPEPVPDPLPPSEGGDGNSDYGATEADPWSGNTQFIDVDPTVATLARVASFAPGPVGMAAGIGNAAVGINNLDWANNQRVGLGLEKLDGWETVKAATGFSDYTDGKVGTVDINGRQREVTYGGGLVGDGPDAEKRTTMTPPEAARRLAATAASKSYNPVGGGGNSGGNDIGRYGSSTPGGAGSGPNRSDGSLAGGSRAGGSGQTSVGSSGPSRSDSSLSGGSRGGDGGNNNGGGNFGAETQGGAGSGPSRGDSSLSGGSRGGGDSGGGGGSSRVICTELYRQGKISREDWKRDLAYTSAHLSDQHVRGYHAWAIPTVRLMRRSRLWTAVWRVLGQARANQIAYVMGDRTDPDIFGFVAKVILEGFCWGVGFFVGSRDAAAELADTKEVN